MKMNLKPTRMLLQLGSLVAELIFTDAGESQRGVAPLKLKPDCIDYVITKAK
ncbi:MAG TPA: hypothetical protein P5186_21125 [Candidatus Paceibacterota bacterium]|nr:hypothetical protein [Candidatus Paceibacterota bacterium]HRZ56575.1 hypothetical protein [Candidatus Paceibacterota bacterium]